MRNEAWLRDITRVEACMRGNATALVAVSRLFPHGSWPHHGLRLDCRYEVGHDSRLSQAVVQDEAWLKDDVWRCFVDNVGR